MFVTAVLAMGALAALLAIVLASADKYLAVEEAERLEALIDAPPGDNCGACGQPGCRGFADITDPAIIDKILTHIRQSRAPPAHAQRQLSPTALNQQTHHTA